MKIKSKKKNENKANKADRPGPRPRPKCDKKKVKTNELRSQAVKKQDALYHVCPFVLRIGGRMWSLETKPLKLWTGFSRSRTSVS